MNLPVVAGPRPTPKGFAIPRRIEDYPWLRLNSLPLWLGLAGYGAVALIVGGILYRYADRAVAVWVYDSLPRGWQQFLAWPTDFGLSTYWLIASAIGAGWCLWRKRPVFLRVFLFLFAAIFIAGMTTNTSKLMFGRYRPTRLFEDAYFGYSFWSGGDSEMQSFPSGHSTVSGAIATVLCLYWPRGMPIWIGFWAYIAWTRVWARAHYPSDVIAGLYVGVSVTLILAAWSNSHRLSRDGADRSLA